MFCRFIGPAFALYYGRMRNQTNKGGNMALTKEQAGTILKSNPHLKKPLKDIDTILALIDALRDTGAYTMDDIQRRAWAIRLESIIN